MNPNLVSYPALEPTAYSSSNNSGTQTLTTYTTTVKGNPIILLDTPGFDDSARSNIDVLSDIVSNLYLFALRGGEIQVRGIIFLYNISEIRFAGSQAKTLEILRTLCGDDCMGNVIIGTTMWDQNSSKFPKQVRREESFSKKYWKGIHSTTRLFEDDEAAANQIIMDLLALPPVLLLVQREIMKPPHTIQNTTVGKLTMPNGYKEIEELKQQKNAQAQVFQAELNKREADFEKREQDMRKVAEDQLRKSEEESRRSEGARLEREAEVEKLYKEQKQKFTEQMKKIAEDEEERELLKRKEEVSQRLQDAQNKRIEKEKQDQIDKEHRRQQFEAETRRQKENSEKVTAQLVEELERLQAALDEMTAPPDLTKFQLTINAVVESFGFRPVFEKAVNKSEKVIKEAIVAISEQIRAFDFANCM